MGLNDISHIRVYPPPQCPECLEPMVLRKPKPQQDWRPFWGCSDYPSCCGKLQIKDNGEPDEGQFED